MNFTTTAQVTSLWTLAMVTVPGRKFCRTSWQRYKLFLRNTNRRKQEDFKSQDVEKVHAQTGAYEFPLSCMEMMKV